MKVQGTLLDAIQYLTDQWPLSLKLMSNINGGQNNILVSHSSKCEEVINLIDENPNSFLRLVIHLPDEVRPESNYIEIINDEIAGWSNYGLNILEKFGLEEDRID